MLNPDGIVNRISPRTRKYRKGPDEVTKLVLGDPVEADTVRWIFEEYGTGLRGHSVLAQDLNARKVLAPAGGPWVAGSVRELLVQRVYVGDIVWNKETQCKRPTNRVWTFVVLTRS